jgi:transcriptional regulator with XRE-family HTH domain
MILGGKMKFCQSKIDVKNNPDGMKMFINSGFTNMRYGTFGEYLQAQLKELKIRPAELARRTGMTPQNISRILTNKPHPITGALPKVREFTVHQIAAALNRPLDEVRDAAGFAPSEEDGTTYILDETAKVKLLNQFLTPEEQAEIADEIALAYQIIVARRQKAKEAREQQAGE